jgi:FHA domain/Protein of unknown function (DUF3662)
MTTLLLILLLVGVALLVYPVTRRKLAPRTTQPLNRFRFRLGLQTGRAISQAVLREVKAQSTVMLKNVWLPNHVAVWMSRVEFERLGAARAQLVRDIEQLMENATLPDSRTREPSHYYIPSEVRVEIHPDDELRAGTYRVRGWIEEGTILEPAGQGDAPQAQQQESGSTESWFLLRIATDDERRLHPLPLGTTTVGRGALADVRIGSPAISREHASITLERGAGITLADLGSRNGTFLRGRRIERPEQLRPGEPFQLGSAVEGSVVDQTYFSP